MLLGCLIFLSLVCSFFAFLPAFHFLQEWLLAFPHYLLFGNIASFLILLLVPGLVFTRPRFVLRYLLLILCSLLAFSTYRTLAPFYNEQLRCTPLQSNRAEDADTRHSVLYANLHAGNKDLSLFFQAVTQHTPDILALVELTPQHSEQLEKKYAISEHYPHQLTLPQDSCFGLGVYSKFPLQGGETQFLSDNALPVLRTHVELASGHLLDLFVVHLQPPMSQSAFYANKRSTRRIATAIRNEGAQKLLVIGDLNSAPGGMAYKNLRQKAFLADAFTGWGYNNTWQIINQDGSRFGDIVSFLVQSKIDHAFYRGLRIQKAQVLSSIGSDHKPLLVHFAPKT